MSSLAVLSSVKYALLAAIAVSLALTPIARAVARRLRVVDMPDGLRKQHARDVPLWGGVVVYLAVLTGLFVVRCTTPVSEAFDQLATTLVFSCGLVCVVGCIDDSRDLNPRFKLLLQIAAVLPVVASGYYFDRIVVCGLPLHFGWLGMPLTVLWLVGCINALNLIDGLDGLASVVGLSTALVMTVIAAQTGHPHVAAVALCLAGALIGFLVFNLPPASIFLGDSGSMVIGLMVGLISIQGALKTSATLSITIPAVVMSVPMFDTVFAIVRRKLAGVPFDVGDRGHIHHKLLERGLTDWQALCIIGALCLTTGAAATAATILRFESLGWITAVSLVVGLIWTRAFGHHEVTLAYQRIHDWAGRVKPPVSIELSDGAALPLATTLPGAITWDAAWQTLLDDLKLRAGQGCELLLANDAGQSRYSVRVAKPPRGQQPAPRVINVRRPSGFAQLHILGIAPSDHDKVADATTMAIVAVLLDQWQTRGPGSAPADLPIEWHHSPIPPRLRAA